MDDDLLAPARPAIEHRRHPRLPLRLPVVLRDPNGEEYHTCWITEACQEGLGITCEGDALPSGGFVEVLLPLDDRPTQAWPRCHAQVIHRGEGRLGVWLGEDERPGSNPVSAHLLCHLPPR